MRRKILLLFLFFLMGGQMFAQEENYISLYLQNFTRYIEWPEDKRNGKFVIEVLGHASVYEKLKERMSGKKVNNQPVELRNYMEASKAGSPHIMFVGHWKSRQMPQVLEQLGQQPTLIVTEKEGMIKKGAAINFVIREGKINFEFNRDQALERGLRMSSRLNELGIAVE